jgi:hypothetical protein
MREVGCRMQISDGDIKESVTVASATLPVTAVLSSLEMNQEMKLNIQIMRSEFGMTVNMKIAGYFGM